MCYYMVRSGQVDEDGGRRRPLVWFGFPLKLLFEAMELGNVFLLVMAITKT